MIRSPIQVADAHAHIRTEVSFPLLSEPEDMLAVMDSLNIEFAAVTSSLANRNDVLQGNAEVDKVLRRHPSRFRGYVSVSPYVPGEALRELERWASFHRPPLIKLHPSVQEYPVDGPKYSPIWDYANQTGAVVLVHTWESSPYCSPLRFSPIARAYPHARILLGHSGVTWRGYEQAMEAASASPNLYLELCGSQRHRTVVARCVERVGAERVLYGSDMPYLEAASTLADVLCAEIPDMSKELILRHNFVRLLEEE
jgi:uncharacterized protein